jgi:elongation factor G
MQVFNGKDVRNIAIAGHGDHGKTSLVAAMLRTARVTNRLTSVDEGNTVTDFDEEEIARKVSISSALAHIEWNNCKLNLIDTPGYNIFINDAKSAMIAADCALIVVDAVAGPEVQTEKVWGFAEEYDIPRILFINKMARERASFERTLVAVKEHLGKPAVAVQLPIGAEKEFRGIVDLVEMKAYEYERDGAGMGKQIDIPADMVDVAAAAREALVEAVAETDEELLNIYLAEMELPEDNFRVGLHNAVRSGDIVPALCGAGLHNMGTDHLLDFLVVFPPSPIEHGEIETEDGAQKITDDAPLSLFVFKTAADAFSGRLTYFKVVSGVLHNEDVVQNFDRDVHEKFSRISVVRGKETEVVPEIHAGDIGVVAKLKETLTGDSLGDKGAPVRFRKAQIPPPAISYAIEPKTRHDEDKLGPAVHKMLEEDSSLDFHRDPQTQQFLLGGNGQQHLEIVVSRLKHRYHVDVELKAPTIPYRETIRSSADAHGRHKKQSGGHGQFGDCKIRMEPAERGEGVSFSDEIFGGAIPKNYIPAVAKGIQEAAERGHLAGYPMVDFRVVLYDGSYHDVDSSEMAFKIAGRKAFREAMEQARPALLEPLMKVEIVAPMDFAGDLMGDLNSRRGRIQGMDTRGHSQVIRAEAPMSEMLTYANDLTSMTQGRGSFTMELSRYDFVPHQAAEKIVAAAQKHGAGDSADGE